MSRITIPVSEIKEGDEFWSESERGWYVAWTATGDAAAMDDNAALVKVVFADGGAGERVWDDGSTEIEVERAET